MLDLENAPTLNDVLLVEKILEKMEDSVMEFKELREKVPKKVNNKVLGKIVGYLEEINRIVVSEKGITWIYNENLKKLLKKRVK